MPGNWKLKPTVFKSSVASVSAARPFGISALIAPDVWLPLGIYSQLKSAFSDSTELHDLAQQKNYTLNVVARLQAGLTIDSAKPRLPVLAQRLTALQPADASGGARELQLQTPSRFSISTTPSDDGPVTVIGALLMGMAAAVLLIASLNLAANGAQAARIWKKIDPAFSARCLAAAERAWEAARANPAIYGAKDGLGGGPYDDDHAEDDFYWAAAELFITTKKDVYKAFIEKSPYFKKVPTTIGDDGIPNAFGWGDVQALGTISLAVVPNNLSAKDIDDCKVAIEAAADVFAALVDQQGYRLPFKPGTKGYPWGSNSFVLNNALVLGLAHDFTHDVRYLNGAAAAMDYILGRNPLDQSYVTGWGDRPLENPYHRFWCHQANPKYPPPPPGILSGGPNSGFEDPYMQGAGLSGCAPQKCFIDNGEAWSANEIAINWNAPLAWVTAFLDERAEGKPRGGKAPKDKGAHAKK